MPMFIAMEIRLAGLGYELSQREFMQHDNWYRTRYQLQEHQVRVRDLMTGNFQDWKSWTTSSSWSGRQVCRSAHVPRLGHMTQMCHLTGVKNLARVSAIADTAARVQN